MYSYCLYTCWHLCFCLYLGWQATLAPVADDSSYTPTNNFRLPSVHGWTHCPLTEWNYIWTSPHSLPSALSFFKSPSHETSDIARPKKQPPASPAATTYDRRKNGKGSRKSRPCWCVATRPPPTGRDADRRAQARSSRRPPRLSPRRSPRRPRAAPTSATSTPAASSTSPPLPVASAR